MTPEHIVILLPLHLIKYHSLKYEEKKFIKCVLTCLSTSYCIVQIITEIVIGNPMFCTGDNYRELLDCIVTLNLEHCLLSWKHWNQLNMYF